MFKHIAPGTIVWTRSRSSISTSRSARVAALRDVTFARDARRVARDRRRERRRQVDAAQDPRRQPAPDRGRPDRSTARRWRSRAHATRWPRGIGLVHQEMLAFPNLSVAANIFAGREITSRFGWLRRSEMRARSRRSARAAPAADLARCAGRARCRSRIASCSRSPARWRSTAALLALDEPTTSLTAAETDHLFRILDDLTRAGVTILYVSHRLPEVFRLCDRITVLRDGRVRRARSIATRCRTTRSCGRWSAADSARSAGARRRSGTASRALRVIGLTRRPCFDDVSLSIAPGEIVGLFGLVGSGRTELLETLVGVHAPIGGSIAVDGRPVRARSPRAAARAGVVLVPEDRQRQGLFFNLSLRHNLVLPAAATRGRSRSARSEVDASEAADPRLADHGPSTAIDAGPPERRQPAEDRPRQVARARAARAAARRADQRRRRRRPSSRSTTSSVELAARGTACPARVERSAGGARAGRSRSRDARAAAARASSPGGR